MPAHRVHGETRASNEKTQHRRGERNDEFRRKRRDITCRKCDERRAKRDQGTGQAKDRSQPNAQLKTTQKTLSLQLKIVE